MSKLSNGFRESAEHLLEIARLVDQYESKESFSQELLDKIDRELDTFSEENLEVASAFMDWRIRQE